MRAPTILACLCALSAAPAVLRAQAPTRPASAARTNIDGRLATRLDSVTGRQVAQLLDEAQRQQLPVEPLVDKALEGASKRAPGPRIVEAVRRLSSELAESRRLLGPRATPEEITAGAHALRAKLAPAALEKLREKRRRATLLASLGTYQELIALKVSEDTAAAAVMALHQADISADRRGEFQHEVAREIAVGGSPGMVAAVATDMLAGDQALSNNLPGTFVEHRGTTSTGGSTPRTKRKP